MKTKTKRESFVERVHEGAQEQLENIRSVREFQKANPEKDLMDSEDYREPLSLDQKIVVNICLSTGGPADGFKLRFTPYQEKGWKKYELDCGWYYRADWGEYEEHQLSDDQADEVFDFYLYGEFPEVA